MNLYLRRVVHPRLTTTTELDEGDSEIGSIRIQHGAAWRWGIDTVILMRVLETLVRRSMVCEKLAVLAR
jgi:hypothetical protein